MNAEGAIVYEAGTVRFGVRLDPRTKLIMVVTITTVLMGSKSGFIMTGVQIILFIIPLLLMALTDKRKAIVYLIIYIIANLLSELLVPKLSGVVAYLFFGFLLAFKRLVPGILMGNYLLVSTTVSELIAALERAYIPKQIIIPLAVMLRFIPTVVGEYKCIHDAMSMRGINKIKNPLTMLEYRVIPLLMSTLNIGSELAASAITRGLSTEKKRTNICKIGFSIWDIILLFICLSAWCLFFASIGGVI